MVEHGPGCWVRQVSRVVHVVGTGAGEGSILCGEHEPTGPAGSARVEVACRGVDGRGSAWRGWGCAASDGARACFAGCWAFGAGPEVASHAGWRAPGL